MDTILTNPTLSHTPTMATQTYHSTQFTLTVVAARMRQQPSLGGPLLQ